MNFRAVKYSDFEYKIFYELEFEERNGWNQNEPEWKKVKGENGENVRFKDLEDVKKLVENIKARNIEITTPSCKLRTVLKKEYINL